VDIFEKEKRSIRSFFTRILGKRGARDLIAV